MNNTERVKRGSAMTDVTEVDTCGATHTFAGSCLYRQVALTVPQWRRVMDVVGASGNDAILGDIALELAEGSLS